MISRPGWTLWFVWLAIYIGSYMLFEVLIHSRSAWAGLPGAVGSGVVSATIAWLFVYRRWLKAG